MAREAGGVRTTRVVRRGRLRTRRAVAGEAVATPVYGVGGPRGCVGRSGTEGQTREQDEPQDTRPDKGIPDRTRSSKSDHRSDFSRIGVTFSL